MNINQLLNTNPLRPEVVFSQSALKAEESGAAKQSADKFTLSDEAKQLISQGKATEQGSETVVKEPLEDKAASADKEPNEKTSANGNSSTELTEEELQQIDELKKRDAEVRAHEQAHTSAAGSLANGGANIDYETGPDGKRYAVSGEVNIDASGVPGDPQATLRKAQHIRRAALAPVDPSAQDRSVAAEASRMEVQARAEISEQSRAVQGEYIAANTPENDFFDSKKSQVEKNIQDTYAKIQNASLQDQKGFVDFFI
ncbi:MAG: hypothetical protein GY694_20735 [Gammaproteobacteria bacterium]|nr:hypothetical protein [Gammaproteobacteria bacterium]